MGEGNENAEVRVSLVADNLADSVIKAVREGMQGVREETEKAKEEAGEGRGLVGKILQAEVEFEALKKAAELVTETIHEAYEMTEKLADAALEASEAQEDQERAMSGNLFLMDRGVHSMEQLAGYASDVREEFSKFGIEAGESTKNIVEAYDALVSRGTMGSEKAKELAEHMAIVGKILPGGMQNLAQGFSMMELGMVRARNPIVQLIASTHTLEGNAYRVAQQMQKMTPEAQMKLGEEAIARQAKLLGKFGEGVGATSLEELRTSLEGVKENFLESMGEPMKNALVPRLEGLRDYLSQHIERIKELGEEAGQAAAKVINWLSEALIGVYEGIHQDWGQLVELTDEFRHAWGEVFGKAADTRTQFRILADDLVQVFAGLLHTVEMANDIAHAQKLGTTEMNVQQKNVEEAAGGATGPEGLEKYKREREKYEKMAKAMTGEDALTPIQDALVEQFDNLAKLAHASGHHAAEAFKKQDWSTYDTYLANAIKHQDEGAEKFALHMLLGSQNAQAVLDMAAGRIEGGMDALMKVVGEQSPDLAAQLKEMKNVVKGEGGIKATQNINFNGAHFDIHQDFKDGDPDRVIGTFRRDVTRNVTSRLESKLSTPFSL